MIMKKIFITLLFVLLFSTVIAQTVSIIPQNGSWKYLDNGSNQDTAWRATLFNDSTWSSGNAELGYGDGGEATVVSYGSNASNRYRTTYFRKAFSVSAPNTYSTFTLGLLRDDGAVVYLNGVEVARSNMPTGTIDYQKLANSAVSGTNESTFYTFTLNPSSFVAGNNVLAVEVHQSAINSSDLSFNLKLDATSVSATCATPSSLASSSITATTASLSWSSIAGATNYNIQYRVVGASTWTTTTATVTTKSLTGLTANSNYEFKVQAVCSVTGVYSATANFTTLAAGNQNLIAANSSWKYLDNGTNQGTAWRATTFNDTAWASGNAELGYGDGGETTVVSYGPSSTAKYITTYFRKSFSVTNPAAFTTLTLDVIRDDGIVVYINGNEVFRNNMPTSTIAYNTLSPVTIGGTDESAWITTTLNTNTLVSGTNVMAVEIHQQAASSTDISFNARLNASTTAAIPVVTRGAYLQKLTPNGITIRWRTDLPCNSTVQYGTSTAYGNTTSDAALTTEHIVSLNGLTPATNYFYTVGTSSQKLQGDVKNNFYTAPLVGSTAPIRIWAIGDFGNGSTQQAAVRNSYSTYTGTTPTNLWIWLGDNAYANGTDLEFQNYVFAQYPDQFKSYPLFPSPGNHDYAGAGYQSTNSLTTNFPYFSIFSVPQNAEAGGVASNTPKYYSYNYGNIHFISLDSYGALNNSSSPMYQWLNNDLAANSQRWTVVYFHHAPYALGSSNSNTGVELIDMRTNIVPLLESYHVDLVLAGHSHSNERSYLIKGHFGLSTTFTQAMKVSTATNIFTKTPPYDGTVYAVCGTSGQNPGATQSGYPMPCMYFNNNTNNCSLVIDVSGDNLSCKYLASTGTVVDQFSITKSGTSKIASTTTKKEEDLIHVYSVENTLNVNYFLSENANVKIDLFNALGQKIISFDQVPAYQLKGDYNFELPLLKKQIAEGLYFIIVTVNGKPIVKKAYELK
jgi:hypothetical protein